MTETRPYVEPAFLPPGTHVGHYSIIEKLGEGGEAVVYRARDLVLERDVALKTPRGEFASPREGAHLLKEARAASRLSHPAIVPIYEVFEDHGRPWFAMSLVEGATLRTVLGHRGALPSEAVARHGEELADALHAAHSKHVLHRDVTPGNIFITPDGRLMLADFGLAQLPIAADGADADARTVSVSRERVAGTLGYMSPEQMMGHEVGPQSDIFSAGAVLYQMATGTRAFGGSTFGEVLDATLNREPPPISGRGNSPPELERIIRKALAKRVDERYASAADMLTDLRALRRKLESGNHETDRGRTHTPSPWMRGALGVALAGAAAAVVWLVWRPAAPPAVVPHQVTSGGGWEAEARISPDGSLVVYAAEVGGNVDLYLADVGGGRPLRLTTDPSPDRSPSWYPDGSAIAFVSQRSGLSDVWKVGKLGGEPTLVVSLADDPAVSPDANRVAFTRPGPDGTHRIFVAPLSDPSAATMLTSARDGLWDHRRPAWSPDGRTLAYSGQRDLWTVDGAGGPARRLTTAGERDVEPVWSSDGHAVYFSSTRQGTSALWRVNAVGGEPARVTLGAGPERQPSISRDGSRLVYSTLLENENLVLVDLRDGKTLAEVDGERAEVSPALAPDHRALAYSSDRRDGRYNVWLQPLSADGVPVDDGRQITDHPGSVSHLNFSPDGRWIVYYRTADGQRDVWTVPVSGGSPQRFTDDPAVDIHPAWSPDGRLIAFASERDGHHHIWVAPVADGRVAGQARRVTEGPLTHLAPAWSPDMASLAFVAVDDRGGMDVWTADLAGSGTATRVTRGAQAQRVVWGPDRRSLIVSGTWDTSGASLRRVDLTTGTAMPFGPTGLFGQDASRGDFAISRDFRLLAATRQAVRSDVWMLESKRGTY